MKMENSILFYIFTGSTIVQDSKNEECQASEQLHALCSKYYVNEWTFEALKLRYSFET